MFLDSFLYFYPFILQKADLYSLEHFSVWQLPCHTDISNAVSLCICLYFYQPQATKAQRATEQRKDFHCVLFLSLFLGEKITKTFMNVLGTRMPPQQHLPSTPSPPKCVRTRENRTQAKMVRRKKRGN